MKVEPLKVINFATHNYGFHKHIFRIHFEVIGPEISGKKAKKLVAELKERLLNFKKDWGTISCYLSELDEFFCSQVSDKKIVGVWHNAKFEVSDSDPSENIRRENYSKMAYLISNEISKWTFSHYKTVLRIESCEPK